MSEFLNIQLIVLYAILDVLLFKNRDNFPLLFSYWTGTNGKKLYYIYRPFQFLLFAGSLYLIYDYSGILPAIAYVLSFCLYLPDLLYYVFGLEINELINFEYAEIETYWLEHCYQIGNYTWKSFKLWQFLAFSFLSLAIMIFSN